MITLNDSQQKQLEHVLDAVEAEPTADDDGWDVCAFCRNYAGHRNHKPDCAVTIARSLRAWVEGHEE